MAQASAVLAVPPSPANISINSPPLLVLSGGPESTGTISFTVTRSGNINSVAAVEYTTVQDGNAIPGDDYTAIPPTLLTFAPGVASQTIPVSVAVGEPAEKAETFGVQLSAGPANVVNGSSPLTLTPGGTCGGIFGSAVGDLNGDGKPDLVAACDSGTILAVFLNTTAPGSSPPTFSGPYLFGSGNSTAVAIADINGDRVPDIVASSGFFHTTAVFLNQTPANAAMPSFAAAFLLPGVGGAYGPNGLAVGDFNQDGKPDIAIADGTNNVEVAVNTTPSNSATPSFTSAQNLPTGNNFSTGTYGLAVGDLNDDGFPDIAAASYFGAVTVFLNVTDPGAVGVATFLAANNFPLPHYEYSVAIGDIDGDGVPDLTALSGQGYITFLRNLTPANSTSPNFAAGVDYRVGQQPTAIAVGDISGDGQQDIVVSDYLQGGELLINNTAAGSTKPSFLSQIPLNAGTNGMGIVIGDFSGDGVPDIAVGGFNHTVSLFINQGAAPATITTGLGVATLIIPDASGATGSSGAGGGASSGAAGTGGSTSAPATGGGGAADPGLLAAGLGLLLLSRARASRKRGG